jgi:hypothetical protein
MTTNTMIQPSPDTDAMFGPDDPRVIFAKAVALAGAVIGATRADQLDNRTPCSEFRVRELLSHLVTALEHVAVVGRGHDPYGAPVLVEGNLSAGTHGQLWTIVVSQGLPGLLFFTAWLLWAWWRAKRRLPAGHPGDRVLRFWCEVTIFIALVQMPYYDLLPWGLAIAMVAAALAWREELAFVRVAEPAASARVLAPA